MPSSSARVERPASPTATPSSLSVASAARPALRDQRARLLGRRCGRGGRDRRQRRRAGQDLGRREVVGGEGGHDRRTLATGVPKIKTPSQVVSGSGRGLLLPDAFVAVRGAGRSPSRASCRRARRAAACALDGAARDGLAGRAVDQPHVDLALGRERRRRAGRRGTWRRVRPCRSCPRAGGAGGAVAAGRAELDGAVEAEQRQAHRAVAARVRPKPASTVSAVLTGTIP